MAGVVENVRSQALATRPEPEMYVPHAQTELRSVMYVVKSSLDTDHVLGGARDLVRRLDPQLPLIFPRAMRHLVEQQLARPRFYFTLLGLFATLALVLATVGVYGVVAYVVSRHA